MIEEAEKYVLKNIHIGMKLDGLVRIDVPEIDPEAFREATVNAFCHRDYRDPEEVRIAIFPDRVEVRNPGTLMEGLTLKTLKSGKVSRRRNPLIADLLRRIHLIEAWGRGIALITEKAPDVRFTQVAGIFITEFPRPITADEASSQSVAGEKPREKTEDRVGDKVGDKVGNKVGDKVGDKLTSNQEAILKALKHESQTSARALSESIGISLRKIETNLAKLKRIGRLRRVGPAKGGYWVVLESDTTKKVIHE